MDIKRYILIALIQILSINIITAESLPPLPTTDSTPSATENPTSKTFFEKIGGIFSNDSKSEPPGSLPPAHPTDSPKAMPDAEDDKPFLDIGNNQLPSIDSSQDGDKENLKIPDVMNMQDAPTAPATHNADTSPQSFPAPAAGAAKTPDNHEELVIPSLPDDEHHDAPITNIKEPPATNTAPSNSTAPNPKDLLTQEPAEQEAQPRANTPGAALDDASTISEVPATYPSINTQTLDTEPAAEADSAAKSPIIIPTLPEENTETPPVAADNQEQQNQVQDSSEEQTDSQVSSEEFVTNETKMLLLPNDDVVLGAAAPAAQLEEMDFFSYFEIFQKYYKSPEDTKRLVEFQNFIAHYYDDPSNESNNDRALSKGQAANEAFDAVRNNNLIALRVVLDNYKTLQSIDESGNNLLHTATLDDDYFVAKFLIVKGVNLSSINYQSQTALDIASRLNNNTIYLLFQKAK
jgi:uncharacterized protein